MATASPKMEDVRLDGKTVIVTGANTGIGKETAKELARVGGRVILACRDRERGEAARAEIVEDTKNDNVVVKILDLSSLQAIKAFADDINENESRIDILVNNAGVQTKSRRETQDGFEMMFGVNYLGHFHLTNLLLDKIKSSAPSRIVNISSLTHKFSKPDFKDLQYKRRFQSIIGYSRSKTANILHCVQLSKILEGTGVTTYAVHPGVIKTELFRDRGTNSFLVKLGYWMSPLVGERVISIPEGAKTTLYCCLEPSIAAHSGRYYARCKEKSAKSYATNAQTAQKLWDISLELCENPPGATSKDNDSD